MFVTRSILNCARLRRTFASVFLVLIPLSIARGSAATRLQPQAAVAHPAVTRAMPGGARTLSIDERVEWQMRIEEVLHKHRMATVPGATSSLADVVKRDAIVVKVEDGLRKSAALGEIWQEPITDTQLQAELERIVRDTKQPTLLSEVFAALDNDPFLISECFVRPELADRDVTSRFARSQSIHASVAAIAEREWKSLARDGYQVDSAKRLTSTYVRRPGGPDTVSTSSFDGLIALDDPAWQELSADLYRYFNQVRQTSPGDALAVPIRVWSPIQEDDNSYFTVFVDELAVDRMVVDRVSWAKLSWSEWWSSVASALPVDPSPIASNAQLPKLESVQLGPDTWAPAASGPIQSSGATSVWTGSEVIIWGGYTNVRSNAGRRYDPVTDTWHPTSRTGAPDGREQHVAVWTGTEMIVWGGETDAGKTATGGRYNPATDSWIPTSIAGAPESRTEMSAVWTGTEMIIWGGTGASSQRVATGGRYSPSTNSWTPTSIRPGMLARSGHGAAWTGSRMMVYGGVGYPSYAANGELYDPASDSWTPTSDATYYSDATYWTLVSVGNLVYVLGGGSNSIAYSYSLTSDQWTPLQGNYGFGNGPIAAAWTGSQLIALGTSSNYGQRYNPTTGIWTSTSAIHQYNYGIQVIAGYWTGSEFVVAAGYDSERYNPITNAWKPFSNVPPYSYSRIGVVWTGVEVAVWQHSSSCGNPTLLYSPVTDSWRQVQLSPPYGYCPQDGASVAWTGTKIIAWGGGNAPPYYNYGSFVDLVAGTTGGIYSTGAPAGRRDHSAVWTGTRMLVWGGLTDSGLTNTGGSYDPVTDTWSALPVTAGSPSARSGQTVEWTGSEMLVWGGVAANGQRLATGSRYSPSTETWAAMSTAQAPTARSLHTSVWARDRMIVWGGSDGTNLLNSGAAYRPDLDQWSPVTPSNAPTARTNHTAVWTGLEMIVWGGADGSPLGTGGRYNPLTNAWAPTNTSILPEARFDHSAVWTGASMFVYAGTVGVNSDPHYNTSAYFYTAPLPQADLGIALAGSPPTPQTGSSASVSIVVSNAGPQPATSVQVSITLPSGVTSANCSSTGGGVCGGTPTAPVVSFASLQSGSNATITITAAIGCSVADLAQLTFSASALSAEFDPNVANSSASTSLTANNPTPVVTCPQNQTATAMVPQGVVVNYPAPTITDNCPGPSVSCAPASGSTFPIGVTTVTCTATDSGGRTANCSFVVTVLDGSPQTADVAVTGLQAVVPTGVCPLVMYQMTARNLGPSAASGTTLTDVLPASTTYAGSLASQGSITAPPIGSPGTVTVTFGQIPAGGSATATVLVNVVSPVSTITNSVSVSSSASDPNPSNNSASLVTPVNFALGAPSNLTATAISSSQINLAWSDNSSNENNFLVDRKTGVGGSWGLIATLGANTTSYANAGLAASTTYYYRVRAANGTGESSNSNEASATTLASGPPELIVNGSFESGATGWTQTPGTIINNSGGTAYDGTWKASILGVATAATHTLYQTPAFPSTGSTKTLRFYMRIQTAETVSFPYDKLFVRITNGSGATLTTLATYSNANSATFANYALVTLTIPAQYAVSGNQLRFVGQSNTQLATTFYVDAVSAQ